MIPRPYGGWVTVGGVYNITVIARDELGDTVDEWNESFFSKLTINVAMPILLPSGKRGNLIVGPVYIYIYVCNAFCMFWPPRSKIISKYTCLCK